MSQKDLKNKPAKNAKKKKSVGQVRKVAVAQQFQGHFLRPLCWMIMAK